MRNGRVHIVLVFSSDFLPLLYANLSNSDTVPSYGRYVRANTYYRKTTTQPRQICPLHIQNQDDRVDRSMESSSHPSSWDDLLPELLGRIIVRLPCPDDRARFRAVCRSWHLAVRQHVRPKLPWIIYSDGTFVTFPDHRIHHGLSFPNNTGFICVDNNWLAFYHTDVESGRHSYFLHNPFTKSTVPLPGLNSVIGDVSYHFEVRKVLMRSTQDDIVVVTTNNWN
uniref:Uncharacterized protein n=1 Tax=Avena sativa TaxID=4498 RepID=A0ACD6A1R1_AVESA